MMDGLEIRRATQADLPEIRRIYNEGIADGIATLDTDPKSEEEMAAWWSGHDDRYRVLVAALGGDVAGWASLNRFSHRCAHAAIADLSIYVSATHRARGIGARLLEALDREAREAGFHKIVLHALDENEIGKRLYRKSEFREVGIFREHGRLEGRLVDVIAMEKLL